MHDGNLAAARGQPVLKELELVGGLQRVVAADRHQGINLQRAERFVHEFAAKMAADARRVVEVVGVRDVLAGVGAGSANQDALRIPGAAEHFVVDHHIVAPRLQRFFLAVFDQMRIAVEDAHDLDIVPQERDGGGRNDRIGRRRRTAGKQDRRPAKRVLDAGGPGKGSFVAHRFVFRVFLMGIA